MAVFLALKKVGVRQYEDSDSKPCVVSMQAGLPVNTIATLEGLCPRIFFCRGGFRWLLLISKGTFQALEQSFCNKTLSNIFGNGF